MFWRKWFPKDVNKNATKFKQTYDMLVNMGVKFPEQINYFKPKKPRNPESRNSIKEEIKNEDEVEILLQNINSQKEFAKSLLEPEDEKEFDRESKNHSLI